MGAADITANPKHLRIVELDAAQVARSLPDVDAAVVNSNYALQAGLDPVNGSLAKETLDHLDQWAERRRALSTPDAPTTQAGVELYFYVDDAVVPKKRGRS